MTAFAALALPTESMTVQLQNREAWNDVRSSETADFFTIGYAGRTVRDIIRLLTSHGVATLVDIRYTPISQYRPEFSKRNLQAAVESAGLSYLHVPSLGVPRDIRGRAVGEADRTAIWLWYDQYVVDRFARRNLHFFFNAADHPVAFMCVEADPTSCHRHRLSRGLERVGLRGFDL
jgi:uncharacterized protein (DUF488 family)